MTDIATLRALRERVRNLTGPDREVDAAIVAALNNALARPYPSPDDFGPKYKWQFWSLDGAHFLGNERRFPVPPLTGSLDAVAALASALWPPSGHDTTRGFAWHLGQGHAGRAYCTLWPHDSPAPAHDYARTLYNAALAAVLSARITEMEMADA